VVWAGVDVGGRRKGFHLAVLDYARRVSLVPVPAPDDCVELLAARSPALVAVDAPSGWAVAGARLRASERAFHAARVCGIRWTPDEAVATARTDRYYEWVEHGIELWEALASAGLPTVECFPTASWTRWVGPRSGRSRAAWSGTGLAAAAALGIGGTGAARNQDARDAVAAALTARQWALDRASVDDYEGLVVPRAGTLERATAPPP
jgi:predicted nuclease with RNAse H fold